jgi:hypothetical protein
MADHLSVRVLVLCTQLSQRSIPTLKDYCRAHALPVGGKKAAILARILKHLGEQDE